MEGIVEFESARSDALNAFDDRRREILAVCPALFRSKSSSNIASRSTATVY
jgi:hypothetical protein